MRDPHDGEQDCLVGRTCCRRYLRHESVISTLAHHIATSNSSRRTWYFSSRPRITSPSERTTGRQPKDARRSTLVRRRDLGAEAKHGRLGGETQLRVQSSASYASTKLRVSILKRKRTCATLAENRGRRQDRPGILAPVFPYITADNQSSNAANVASGRERPAKTRVENIALPIVPGGDGEQRGGSSITYPSSYYVHGCLADIYLDSSFLSRDIMKL